MRGRVRCARGLDLAYTDCRSARAVLLQRVDQAAYAMSYTGQNGHLLVPDELKDERFCGLRFLVRRLDSGEVNDLVRRRPTPAAAPTPRWSPLGRPSGPSGIAENVEIIRRIGWPRRGSQGHAPPGQPPGLRGELARPYRHALRVEPSALLSDIRE